MAPDVMHAAGPAQAATAATDVILSRRGQSAARAFPGASGGVSATAIAADATSAGEVRGSLGLANRPTPRRATKADELRGGEGLEALKWRNSRLEEQVRQMREGHIRTVVHLRSEVERLRKNANYQVHLIDFWVDADKKTEPLQEELEQLTQSLAAANAEISALKGKHTAEIKQARMQRLKEVALLKMELQRLQQGGQRTRESVQLEDMLNKEDLANELEEARAQVSRVEESHRLAREKLIRTEQRLRLFERTSNFFKDAALERTLLLEKTLRLLKLAALELGHDGVLSFDDWARRHRECQEEDPTSSSKVAARLRHESALEAERLEEMGTLEACKPEDATRLSILGQSGRTSIASGAGDVQGLQEAIPGDTSESVSGAASAADRVRAVRRAGDLRKVNLDELHEAILNGETLSKESIWIAEFQGSPGLHPERSRRSSIQGMLQSLNASAAYSSAVRPGSECASVAHSATMPYRGHFGASAGRRTSHSLVALFKKSPPGTADPAMLEDLTFLEADGLEATAPFPFRADSKQGQTSRKMMDSSLPPLVAVLPPLLPYKEGLLPTHRPKRGRTFRGSPR